LCPEIKTESTYRVHRLQIRSIQVFLHTIKILKAQLGIILHKFEFRRSLEASE
jgi:hypothetical protein